MDEQPLRGELITLADFAWQRLGDRLEGLSDDEYLWEPTAGCWTIRRRTEGLSVMDFEWPPPEPPPITTIAWRLAHLVTDDRFGPWLGLGPSAGRPPVPSSAADAVAAVARTQAAIRDALLEIADADLWRPIGPIGGPFAESSRTAWVLHILDEIIHHGAEVALLRDLYRARYRS
jgi:hypothetical protein